MDEIIKKYQTLQEFFHQRVHDAASSQKVDISPDVEFYLVCLLAHFSRTENFFQQDEQGRNELKALALRLADAAFTEKADQKFVHLKSLADSALYHAGVFFDGLLNKVIDVDYYIDLGGATYQNLAHLSTHHRKKPLAEIFSSLSRQFAVLAEVVHVCCEQEVATTDADLLRLLDRYLKTGSQKAKEILEEKGILLDQPLTTSDVQ